MRHWRLSSPRSDDQATHRLQWGLERWVMGSVTDRILNTTKLPLLVVRPPKQRSTALEDQRKEKTDGYWPPGICGDRL